MFAILFFILDWNPYLHQWTSPNLRMEVLFRGSGMKGLMFPIFRVNRDHLPAGLDLTLRVDAFISQISHPQENKCSCGCVYESPGSNN